VVAGLTTSTLITLVSIPVLYAAVKGKTRPAEAKEPLLARWGLVSGRLFRK
jgi:hypothetical protein